MAFVSSGGVLQEAPLTRILHAVGPGYRSEHPRPIERTAIGRQWFGCNFLAIGLANRLVYGLYESLLEDRMNIVAIMASYRKGRTIDTLVDQAIAGALTANPDATAEKISLVDKQIEYCRNCKACRNDDPSKPLAHCAIQDDMQAIYPVLDAADAYIIGTPISMGNETALLKAFFERSCFVLGKPRKSWFSEAPIPRNPRKRQAVAILSTGVVPPWLRLFSDDATPLIKGFCNNVLNARLIDSLYAGAIEKRSVDYYTKAAYRLGRELIT